MNKVRSGYANLLCLSLSVAMVVSVLALPSEAQSGGAYQIEQSAIAPGGRSSGGAFSLESAIGQPVAVGPSTGGSYSVYSGFLARGVLVLLAAGASISGRVLRHNGKGINRAKVTLTDMLGNARTTLTRNDGSYRFDDVETGDFYLLQAVAKKLEFLPKYITLYDSVADFDFMAER